MRIRRRYLACQVSSQNSKGRGEQLFASLRIKLQNRPCPMRHGSPKAPSLHAWLQLQASRLHMVQAFSCCTYTHLRAHTHTNSQTPTHVHNTARRYLQALPQPQWLKCDIRTLDMTVLGKFGVIMADPPWQVGGFAPGPNPQASGYIFKHSSSVW